MVLTPKTQQEDERLRKELQNADLEKLKKVLKTVAFPKKASQGREKNTKRH